MGRRAKHFFPVSIRCHHAQLALAGLFLLGGMIGIFFVRALSDPDKTSLCSYLVEYLRLIHAEALTVSPWRLLSKNLWLFFTLLLLGAAVFGLVGIPFLILQQGFFLGFGVACCWLVFGFRGLGLAFALFLLPAFLLGSAVFLIGGVGLARNWNLFCASVLDWGNFGRSAVIGLCLLTLGVWIEFQVVPILLRLSASLIL